MDRAFLAYYENELSHLRTLAAEFSAMHPTVAEHLSLNTVPCPDPYVERLLEGVAYLGARTRLKLDYEASRHVRDLLDALYPDLAAPAPAMTLATLVPGPQVDTMLSGHVVKRGTRLVAGLRDGLSTRAVYTTAQQVQLWPIRLAAAEYLQDRGALKSAGVGDRLLSGTEAGLRMVIERTSDGPLSELSLDRLDVHCKGGGHLFDAIMGWGRNVVGRPVGSDAPFQPLDQTQMVGIADDEGLLPRVRPSFEGYRLLREYFLMPERFHYARLTGLRPIVRKTSGNAAEVIMLLSRQIPALSEVGPKDFTLFTTPIINLFERECNVVELRPNRASHIVHADRTRPRDFEIYRLLRVEDAEREGPDAALTSLYSVDQRKGSGLVFTTNRRRRRPADDELVAGQLRTSYPGDDFHISVARPPGARSARQIRRLDIRALCTNRDLPILDDTPRLTLEAGDPVRDVRLLQAMRRPRPSLQAELPYAGRGEVAADDLAWRWIAQLSLNFLSIAEGGAASLQALLALYADRGDPAYSRHGRAIVGVASRPVIDRVALPGPACFAHGTEITLDIDETVLSGTSHLLLGGLLAQLFARSAAINSFVRTRTHLSQKQVDIRWPNVVGTRTLI